MKAEFKRDLKNNYLVIEGQEEAVGNDYCIPMVEQNRIPGLLPFHRSRTDGKLYLNYEITGKQTVASLYERRRIGYEEILQLLMGISSHLDMLQRYLLRPEQLLFDPQYLVLLCAAEGYGDLQYAAGRIFFETAESSGSGGCRAWISLLCQNPGGEAELVKDAAGAADRL